MRQVHCTTFPLFCQIKSHETSYFDRLDMSTNISWENRIRLSGSSNSKASIRSLITFWMVHSLIRIYVFHSNTFFFSWGFFEKKNSWWDLLSSGTHLSERQLLCSTFINFMITVHNFRKLISNCSSKSSQWIRETNIKMKFILIKLIFLLVFFSSTHLNFVRRRGRRWWCCTQ